ncbi:MAG: hypothetical protein J0H43_07340 [Actinobacteria bacterium]|nr:hypothetical protein [Actinomycetota bacterium]
MRAFNAGLSSWPEFTVRAASAAQARMALTAGSASYGDSGAGALEVDGGADVVGGGVLTEELVGLGGGLLFVPPEEEQAMTRPPVASTAAASDTVRADIPLPTSAILLG